MLVSKPWPLALPNLPTPLPAALLPLAEPLPLAGSLPTKA
jgi:hypothetical protein